MNDIIAMFIVVVAIAAAIHRVDVGPTCEADVCINIGQRSVAVRSNVMTLRKNAVGDLSGLARAVVAAIEGTGKIARHADGTARHSHLVATQDGSHVATAKHIPMHLTAIHAQRGQAHEFRKYSLAHRSVGETHWCHVATRINISLDQSISCNDHMGLIVSRDEPAHIVFGFAVVDTFDVSDAVVTMIETIAAAEKVFVDLATRSLDIGSSLHFLILYSWRIAWRILVNTLAAHVATDVAAAIDSAHMAVLKFHPGAIVHIALLAAAIEIVDQDVGAIHLYMGAIMEHKVIESFIIKLECHGAISCKHVAFVATAVNGANAS